MPTLAEAASKRLDKPAGSLVNAARIRLGSLEVGESIAGMRIAAGKSEAPIHYRTHGGGGVYDITETEIKRRGKTMEQAAAELADQGYVVAVRRKGQRNIFSNHLHFADPDVNPEEANRLRGQKKGIFERVKEALVPKEPPVGYAPGGYALPQSKQVRAYQERAAKSIGREAAEAAKSMAMLPTQIAAGLTGARTKEGEVVSPLEVALRGKKGKAAQLAREAVTPIPPEQLWRVPVETGKYTWEAIKGTPHAVLTGELGPQVVTALIVLPIAKGLVAKGRARITGAPERIRFPGAEKIVKRGPPVEEIGQRLQAEAYIESVRRAVESKAPPEARKAVAEPVAVKPGTRAQRVADAQRRAQAGENVTSQELLTGDKPAWQAELELLSLADAERVLRNLKENLETGALGREVSKSETAERIMWLRTHILQLKKAAPEALPEAPRFAAPLAEGAPDWAKAAEQARRAAQPKAERKAISEIDSEQQNLRQMTDDQLETHQNNLDSELKQVLTINGVTTIANRPLLSATENTRYNATLRKMGLTALEVTRRRRLQPISKYGLEELAKSEAEIRSGLKALGVDVEGLEKRITPAPVEAPVIAEKAPPAPEPTAEPVKPVKVPERQVLLDEVYDINKERRGSRDYILEQTPEGKRAFQRAQKAPKADPGRGESVREHALRMIRKQKSGISSETKVMLKDIAKYDRRIKEIDSILREPTGEAAPGPSAPKPGLLTVQAAKMFNKTPEQFVTQLKAEPAYVRGIDARLANKGWEPEKLDALWQEAGIKSPRAKAGPAADVIEPEVIGRLDAAEAVVKERIANRGTTMKTGVDPFELADYVELGTIKLAKGVVKFADWSTQMIEAVGEQIKPHLKRIWAAAQKRYNARVKGQIARGEEPQFGERPVEKLTTLIKAAKPARVETAELQHKALQVKAAKVAGAQETYTGEEAFRRGFAAMRGELPKAEFEAPRVKMTGPDIHSLFEDIRLTDTFGEKSPFAKQNTAQALTKLLLGEIPQRAELALLEKVFGTDLVTAVLKKRPLGARAWENIADLLNLPRSVMAAYDFSAALRQGAIMLTRKPTSWARGVREGFRVMFSEKALKAKMEAMEADPLYEEAINTGLYLRTRRMGTAAELSMREETFMSRFAESIPGVRLSERNFNMTLDAMGFDYWKSIYNANKGRMTATDLRELSGWTNKMLGRGYLGKGESIAQWLSAGLFSPRYMVSRFQALLKPLTSPSAMIRREAARSLVQFVAAGTTTLALLDFSGLAEVETDPRSSDFGKIQIGKIRFDFWAGYQPIVRYIAQFITGQRKVLDSEKIIEAKRLSVLGSFARSKLAPPPGAGYSILAGKTYIGEKVTPGKLAAETLTPMAWQDIVDAGQEYGWGTGLLVAPAALTGIGVQVHRDRPTKTTGTPWEPYIPGPETEVTNPYIPGP